MPIFNALGATSRATILQLPNLIGWWDANDPNNNNTQPANNASVSIWYDKSGNGNNVSGSGGQIPTYKTSILNSKPIIRFDGIANTLISSLFTSSTQHTITVVSNVSNAAPAQIVVYNGASGSNGYGYFINTARQILFGGHAQKVDGVDTTSFEIITLTWDGSTSLFYLNGVSQVITNAATAPGTPTSQFSIGSQGSGNFMGGDIAEVIFHTSALSTQYLQPEWAYLSGKWGIAVP